MTKTEAIQAMKNGKKVTHKLFFDDEYIFMDDHGVIRDENNYRMAGLNFDFWTDRKGPEWDRDWSVYE